MTVEFPGLAAPRLTSWRVLGGEIHAHNTFEEPGRIAPRDLLKIMQTKQPRMLKLYLPPASINVLTYTAKE